MYGSIKDRKRSRVKGCRPKAVPLGRAVVKRRQPVVLPTGCRLAFWTRLAAQRPYILMLGGQTLGPGIMRFTIEPPTL